MINALILALQRYPYTTDINALSELPTPLPGFQPKFVH
jgi:hypothetical protein